MTPRIFRFKREDSFEEAVDLNRIVGAWPGEDPATTEAVLDTPLAKKPILLPMPYDEFIATWQVPEDRAAERFGRMREIEMMIDWIEHNSSDSMLAHLTHRLALFKQGCVA